MFRTVPLSIIRSFSLYTQQWYISFRPTDSLRGESATRCTNFSNSFLNKSPHVSDCSSVHHQEFFTVHTVGSGWNCSSVLILLASCHQTCKTHTIAVCTMKNSWYGQRICPKHVYFYFGPMPPRVLVDFVVLPPGHGSSVADFWGWDTHEAQLRCPDDVSGDLGGWSARRALKPKFY